MTDKIRKYLKSIEESKNIEILWACETGSRAWGFASTDSDFDIRLIYVHKKDWYLSLSEKKDTIDKMLENNDIDISGWDLKKSLALLRKSNAPILERIQSPIVYKSDPEFINDILDISNTCYSRIATIHHYLSMSKKFVADLELNRDYKLKKFFYALRSAFVCKWILEKKEKPPIEFDKIYPNLGIESTLISRIEELIKLKSSITESYLHSGEQPLLDLIQNFNEEAELKKETLPPSKCDSSQLDRIFRKYISKYDN
ncbi:nucleotidyltransferase domain-containing protein [Portibacter marinus]|uniref:nucleotidyltransferase domain-containing protein n=1 Tax=Portibacter marinus TaxID=2898660 RepID=UPI001F230402|nr:nucleotidyltransferase domain-containing protein [Portibacter marinus]